MRYNSTVALTSGLLLINSPSPPDEDRITRPEGPAIFMRFPLTVRAAPALIVRPAPETIVKFLIIMLSHVACQWTPI